MAMMRMDYHGTRYRRRSNQESNVALENERVQQEILRQRRTMLILIMLLFLCSAMGHLFLKYQIDKRASTRSNSTPTPTPIDQGARKGSKKFWKFGRKKEEL